MPQHAPSTDKLLFTPGPLTTSLSVRQAMLRDLGSRDHSFIELIRDIRRRLLLLAGEADDSRYTAIPMQGSGTFGIESVIGSVIPPDGHLLVIVNGAYGRRMVEMARALRISVDELACPEDQTPDLMALRQRLQDPAISHVAAVHCETTTGILNPVEAIGSIVREAGPVYIVDAMSSFGAVPLNLAQAEIDYLISSSNKCIEGVPGFAFVLARRADLERCAGWARSLSLDLYQQWRALEQSGQFRFTPPVHAMLAFHQALLELEAEGGVSGRAARYAQNHRLIYEGMQRLGFHPYLPPELQSYIITTFHNPQDANFNFERFYQLLSEQGCVIYPGKLTQADCFRIGNIGRLYSEHMRQLLTAVEYALQYLGSNLAGSS